jgi:3-phosphoglycerate kinase
VWLQGRPKDGPEDKFRLKPIAPRLKELLGVEVNAITDCVGDVVKDAVEKASNGSVRSFFLFLFPLFFSIFSIFFCVPVVW